MAEPQIQSPEDLDLMTEEDVVTLLQEQHRNSIGFEGSTEVPQQRSDAMDRYLGEKYGDEVDGRSQIISRDVTDAVEWAMPQLIDVFFGGEHVVELDPQPRLNGC